MNKIFALSAAVMTILVLGTSFAHAEFKSEDELVRFFQEGAQGPVFRLSASEMAFEVLAPGAYGKTSLAGWVAQGLTKRRPDLDVTLPSLVPAAKRAHQVTKDLVCYQLENVLTRSTGAFDPEDCYLVPGGL